VLDGGYCLDVSIVMFGYDVVDVWLYCEVCVLLVAGLDVEVLGFGDVVVGFFGVCVCI